MNRQTVTNFIKKKYGASPEYLWKRYPDYAVFRDMLVREEGIFPAYHMNKLHWVTVLLDGTVSEQQVYDLIETSFLATASAKKKEKLRPPKEWIIPANPKYYDIEHAFDSTKEIDWKQGAGVTLNNKGGTEHACER